MAGNARNPRAPNPTDGGRRHEAKGGIHRPSAAAPCCAAPWGIAIADALADPLVVEIMVNPDGRLWLDRLGEGRIDTGLLCEAAQTERIIRLVASHARGEAHADAPIISAELPPHGRARRTV
jgi:hypothetical protein